VGIRFLKGYYGLPRGCAPRNDILNLMTLGVLPAPITVVESGELRVESGELSPP